MNHHRTGRENHNHNKNKPFIYELPTINGRCFILPTLFKSRRLLYRCFRWQMGPSTNKADADFTTQSASIAEQLGRFDARSESNLVTLLPVAQKQARLFLLQCQSTGFDVRIVSGTRTYAEQEVLYAQGRTAPGLIVTHASGGQSNHNFGIAWDIGLFIADGSYNQNDADYITVAQQVLPAMNNIEWGGNWHSIVDNPHYQLTPVSDSVAVVCGLFEEGEMYV